MFDITPTIVCQISVRENASAVASRICLKLHAVAAAAAAVERPLPPPFPLFVLTKYAQRACRIVAEERGSWRPQGNRTPEIHANHVSRIKNEEVGGARQYLVATRR